jgi:hypothetical protein
VSVKGAFNRIPIIHLGLPRTATKTLQWRLFACHSEIYYMGRYDGHIFKGKYSKFDACRDEDVQTIMNEIAYGHVYSPDFGKCQKILEGIFIKANEKNLVPVWSWESYSTDILSKKRVRARNLKKVFGEAKIFITLRNPVTLLESAYFLHLRRDNVGARWKGRWPFYYPIEKWLEKYFIGEVQYYLQYAETIKVYVEHFGLDNIHVFLFEDLLNDRQLFFEKICMAMEIDVDEGVKLTEKSVDNTRWTEAQIDALIKIKKSKLQSLSYRFSDKSRRKEMLGLDHMNMPLVKGNKAEAQIPSAWKKRILTLTREGNVWLTEKFNLPLSQYGYFG